VVKEFLERFGAEKLNQNYTRSVSIEEVLTTKIAIKSPFPSLIDRKIVPKISVHHPVLCKGKQ